MRIAYSHSMKEEPTGSVQSRVVHCRSTASGTQGRRHNEGSVRHPHWPVAVLRQHPTPDHGSETRRS